MSGRLTTHVLDTAQGKPAAGLLIELWHIEPSGRRLLQSVHTNADGRTEQPLLREGTLEAGLYELMFHLGDYFSMQPLATTTPPFLDVVPVRFAITDPDQHYHVPLLASPWAYSTYRGS